MVVSSDQDKSIIKELQTFIIGGLLIVMFLTLLLVAKCAPCKEYVKEKIENKKAKFFNNGLIRMFDIAFLKSLSSVCFQLLLWRKGSEFLTDINFILMCLLLVLSFLQLGIITRQVYLQREEDIDSEDYKNKYENLTHQIHPKGDLVHKQFLSANMVKRMLMIFTPVVFY